MIKEIDLLEINDFIMDELRKNDLPILKIYYCTDHPDFSSKSRKPGTGMFLDASKEFDINLSNCLMIGDSIDDIRAGEMLGMDTMLVLTGRGQETMSNLLEYEMPTYIVEDLSHGVEKLCH